MPNQRDKKLNYLLFLPNNDLVMTKCGSRFELFDHMLQNATFGTYT